MRHYSPRELRLAIALTALLTALAMLALLDPSCRRRDETQPPHASRLLPPR
jgi:hypothetical protein